MPLNQRGLVPIVIVLIIAIIGGVSVVTIRNRTTTTSTPETSESTSSAQPTSTPSASPKAVLKKSPSPSVKPTPPSVATKTSPTPSPTSTSTPPPPPPPPPSGPNATNGVTVTYPNGGETIKWQEPLTIKYNAPTSKVAIRLNRYSGNYNGHYVDITAYTDNTGSYTWTPSSQLGGGSFIGEGFKISVEKCCAGEAVAEPITPADQSDGTFSIVP